MYGNFMPWWQLLVEIHSIASNSECRMYFVVFCEYYVETDRISSIEPRRLIRKYNCFKPFLLSLFSSSIVIWVMSVDKAPIFHFGFSWCLDKLWITNKLMTPTMYPTNRIELKPFQNGVKVWKAIIWRQQQSSILMFQRFL